MRQPEANSYSGRSQRSRGELYKTTRPDADDGQSAAARLVGAVFLAAADDDDDGFCE